MHLAQFRSFQSNGFIVILIWFELMCIDTAVTFENHDEPPWFRRKLWFLERLGGGNLDFEYSL